MLLGVTASCSSAWAVVLTPPLVAVTLATFHPCPSAVQLVDPATLPLPALVLLAVREPPSSHVLHVAACWQPAEPHLVTTGAIAAF